MHCAVIHIIAANDDSNAPPKVLRLTRRLLLPFIFALLVLFALAVWGAARLVAGHWVQSRAPIAREIVGEHLRASEEESRRRQEAEFAALRGEIANLRAQAARLANTGGVIAERLRLPADIINDGEVFSCAPEKEEESAAGFFPAFGKSEYGYASAAAELSALNNGYSVLRRQYGLLREQGAAEGVAADTVPILKPVVAERSWRTSGFGMRRDPFTGRRAFHAGYDYAARRGSTVVAGASGVVIYSGRLGNYGNAVRIDHGRGVSTLYGHLRTVYVNKSAFVQKGDAIGEVGSTGRSSGPHLHYEVRVNNRPRPVRRALGKLRKQRQLPKQ